MLDTGKFQHRATVGLFWGGSAANSQVPQGGLTGTAGPAPCEETGMAGPDSEPLDRGTLGCGRNSVRANCPDVTVRSGRDGLDPDELGGA